MLLFRNTATGPDYGLLGLTPAGRSRRAPGHDVVVVRPGGLRGRNRPVSRPARRRAWSSRTSAIVFDAQFKVLHRVALTGSAEPDAGVAGRPLRIGDHFRDR